MMIFKDKLQDAPQWQLERFEKVMDQLEGIDLSDDEKGTMLWLCGFEQESIDNVMAVIGKSVDV